MLLMLMLGRLPPLKRIDHGNVTEERASQFLRPEQSMSNLLVSGGFEVTTMGAGGGGGEDKPQIRP